MCATFGRMPDAQTGNAAGCFPCNIPRCTLASLEPALQSLRKDRTIPLLSFKTKSSQRFSPRLGCGACFASLLPEYGYEQLLDAGKKVDF